MKPPVLQISNLVCMRAQQPLFAPITLSMQLGDMIILRGVNGSGKSTLLRTLAGLIPVTQGSVTSSLSCLYLGHANALHPSLRVCEQLDFWRGLSPSNQISNATILETLGLTAQVLKTTAQLSNGQKRRLALARLLLDDARLWLLDEPHAALDKEGAALLYRLLSQHQQNGGVAIIASHDPLDIAGAHTLQIQAAA